MAITQIADSINPNTAPIPGLPLFTYKALNVPRVWSTKRNKNIKITARKIC